jgi:tRNA(Ile)-lysidine synthase
VLSVLHVEHGLRGKASVDDAAFVQELAERLNLPCEVMRVDTPQRMSAYKESTETAARALRYQVFGDVLAASKADKVATAHTLDDQAETVLLGLARGSGARSLAGMPARRGRLLRPFLGIRRETTSAACRALDLTAWADPHNRDPAYARARVRAAAIPALEDALGPGVAEALARSASLLRDDADALDAWAERESAAPLDVERLAALPAAVRTRVLRRAALAAGANPGELAVGHVRDIEQLVTHWRGQGPVSLPGGLVAERTYDRLSFQ